MADILPFRRRGQPPAEDDDERRADDEASPGDGGATPRSLRAARRDRAQRRARGRTLCGRGFHDWSVDGGTRFDVRQGRLVTVVRCARCDATRRELR